MFSSLNLAMISISLSISFVKSDLRAVLLFSNGSNSPSPKANNSKGSITGGIGQNSSSNSSSSSITSSGPLTFLRLIFEKYFLATLM